MHRTAHNLAPACLLGALLASTLTACSSDGTPAATSGTAPTTVAVTPSLPASSAATTGTGAPGPSPTAVPSSAVSAPPGTIAIRYAGGKVTGSGERTKVKLGSTVTINVTSDIADEVHLHGYDKSVDVAAGDTASLTFTASIPGVFEMELENSGAVLTRLQVQ